MPTQSWTYGALSPRTRPIERGWAPSGPPATRASSALLCPTMDPLLQTCQPTPLPQFQHPDDTEICARLFVDNPVKGRCNQDLRANFSPQEPLLLRSRQHPRFRYPVNSLTHLMFNFQRMLLTIRFHLSLPILHHFVQRAPRHLQPLKEYTFFIPFILRFIRATQLCPYP